MSLTADEANNARMARKEGEREALVTVCHVSERRRTKEGR